MDLGPGMGPGPELDNIFFRQKTDVNYILLCSPSPLGNDWDLGLTGLGQGWVQDGLDNRDTCMCEEDIEFATNPNFFS